MLAIDRIGLPPALVASLKHLASLHNPEFHQREQLRLSTWNTPWMVRCYSEDLDRLYLPRGLVEEAAKVVESAGSELEIDDQRQTMPTRPFTFTGELSPAQEEAVAELTRHDMGVLVAPTGAGKTVMACALIARLSTPTLVLVHTKPLAEQWRQRLGDLLGLDRRQIGQLGAGRTRRSGIVNLATLQTLARRDDALEVFDGYGLVVVDECHHLPASILTVRSSGIQPEGQPCAEFLGQISRDSRHYLNPRPRSYERDDSAVEGLRTVTAGQDTGSPRLRPVTCPTVEAITC